MSDNWKTKLQNQPHLGLLWDEASRIKYSMDYHHFSPILVRDLQGSLGECIASPTTEEELDELLAFAAREKVPVTVRGNGTGNYGQCVPVTGGLVLNLSKYNKILETSDGIMRVQAGARLGKMESTARRAGYELRTMPSTFQSATIGGFLCGGFGGIGSIRWGTIWDGLVTYLKIKTVEPVPRTIELYGSEVRPYLHTYGTIGILAEVGINLAPRMEWMQWAVAFNSFADAFRFGREAAEAADIDKRLISVHEWPIPACFEPLKLEPDQAVVLMEADEQSEEQLRALITAHQGSVALKVAADRYHKGVGVSDFSWNHTTLWARKQNPDLTYLQLGFDNARAGEQLALMKQEHPEVMNHIEFASQGGELLISGLPLLAYKSDEQINGIIRRYEEMGVSVSNPHTWDLDEGGRSYSNEKLWAIKRSQDPYELLNQKKLKQATTG